MDRGRGGSTAAAQLPTRGPVRGRRTLPSCRKTALRRGRASASGRKRTGSAAEGAAKARAFVASNWIALGDVAPASGGGPSLGEWDVLLQRAKTHTFFISGMAFQDAWTLDLERLRDCCIHTVSPDGRLIPFCAYNLTSRNGRALYRGKERSAENTERRKGHKE